MKVVSSFSGDVMASPTRRGKDRGMTLIEITLVIAVLLGIIAIVFIGISAYKLGSDRALCIQRIASVQKVMRAYCNVNRHMPGDTVNGLEAELIGTPQSVIPSIPECPSGGVYTFLGDQVPNGGVLYMECSYDRHVPEDEHGIY